MRTKIKSGNWAAIKAGLALVIIIPVLMAFANVGPGTKYTPQTQLNQTELFRQFLGTWKLQVNKDTVYTFVCKAVDDGLDVDLTCESSGQITMEQKALISYDQKSNKFIQKSGNQDTPPYAMWFDSPDICKAGPIDNFSDLANIRPDRRWQFKAPGQLTLFVNVGDKEIEALVLKKVL